MISYNNIDNKYLLKDKLKLKEWILNSIEEEGLTVNFISFNFCTDKYILELNNSA